MAIVDFFLGSSSPQGYVDYFSQTAINQQYSFLIRGTPGSGKSTLMNKIWRTFSDSHNIVERIHCSADPDSLDGVLFDAEQVAVFDATAPHTVLPQLPVAAQTEVSLFDCIAPELVMERRRGLEDTYLAANRFRTLSQNYLQAASSLLQDNLRTVLNFIDVEKIHKTAMRFCQKELPNKKRLGVEHQRMLSAITPDGVVFYEQTPQTLCDQIVVVKDEYGSASGLLLEDIRAWAVQHGYTCYTCTCPLSSGQRLEHVILPEAGLAFLTSNRFHPVTLPPSRVIHSNRFTDVDGLKRRKQRLSFNRKAAEELLKQAIQKLQAARECHDRIEEVYIQAADFAQIDRITARLMNRLAGFLARY